MSRDAPGLVEAEMWSVLCWKVPTLSSHFWRTTGHVYLLCSMQNERLHGTEHVTSDEGYLASGGGGGDLFMTQDIQGALRIQLV